MALLQNVVMVMASSSIDLLHVARQRQWGVIVTGRPSSGTGAPTARSPSVRNTRVTGAISRVLEVCVEGSGVVMSADTRAKFSMEHDALLQTCVTSLLALYFCNNQPGASVCTSGTGWPRRSLTPSRPCQWERVRLALPQFIFVTLDAGTALLWDCVLSRWCEKEEGGSSGMSSTVRVSFPHGVFVTCRAGAGAHCCKSTRAIVRCTPSLMSFTTGLAS